MNLGNTFNRLGTLQTKFLFFVIPSVIGCFLIFSIILSIVRYQERKQDTTRNLNNHAKIQSAILAKSLWSVNFNLAEIQMESVLLIPHISGIEVVEFTTGKVLNKGYVPDASEKGNYETITHKIQYLSLDQEKHIGDLTVFALKSSIYNPLYQSLIRNTLLLLILLVAIIVSAVIANNIIVGKPLTLFLSAIQKADSENKREIVKWSSNDEIGAVITAYNNLLENLNEAEMAEKQSQKDKKALNEQLQQAKRMETVGLMAGGVAHDLNNILSGIVSYPELILQKLPEDSDLRKSVQAIHESGTRAAVVVDDLLTIAKGAASTRETHDINSLIREYLGSPEHKKLKNRYPNVKYKNNSSTLQPHITCSPVHIKKCLMNLVANAAEAISDEGLVTITTENRYINDVVGDQHNISSGEFVVLSIHDNGHGISEEDLKNIFEPFYTQKIMGRGGTGLGLTVVWNTMENHDGRVIVTSDEHGTCFKLFFPVSEKTDTDTISDTALESLTGNSESILIVDDEQQLRDIACQMLQNLGYKVDSVSSGELAVEFVKNKPVDLIVLDMLMNPGINGRQTYEEITKLHPNQNAIVTSGYSESEDVKAVLRLGASVFIKKPYSMTRLGLAVKEALHG